MKRTIIVDTVQSTPKTIVIQSKNGETYKNGDPKFDKFKIWINDQEGNQSKAYTQYQKLRPIAGDRFEVEVFEKESSFTNQQGKLINFTDRTINFFYTDENGNPTKPQEAKNEPTIPAIQESMVQVPSSELETLRSQIKAGFDKRDVAIEELATKVIDLSEKVSYMTEMFALGHKEAWEIHKEHMPKIDKEQINEEPKGL